jgi:hypothetical protein
MQFITCDVATYCIGQAASMGAVLLTAGAAGKRNALPNSRIMIHQPLAGMEGTAEDIMIHAKEFKKIKHKLNHILIKHTGHPLDQIENNLDMRRAALRCGDGCRDIAEDRRHDGHPGVAPGGSRAHPGACAHRQRRAMEETAPGNDLGFGFRFHGSWISSEGVLGVLHALRQFGHDG